MSSETKPQDAIDFLALVRKDLEEIGYPQKSDGSVASSSSSVARNSTIVTSRFSEVAIDTHIEPTANDALTLIGRFEIIELLGEGGFARVFLANDPNLDREVALKVPKPQVLLSPESVARFEREAKSAAILSHPNIVPVFETGSLGPIHFIASEFCAGPTLRQWISDSDELSTAQTAAEIVRGLADALQHAHQRGIIHRDLKPANIILVDGDGTTASRLRITDFGLARQVADDESLTANGAIVGTPAYMSPEQALGKGVVDHRTDIHSLGMILYELLTGKSPFKRNSHMASIAAVINESVPSIRIINQKIDADLEAVCLKALEKDPESRYQSAHEFGLDLQHWIDGRAVSVRKPTQTETFRRWLKRNPVVATAVLFGVMSLSVGLAFSFAQWKKLQANQNQLIQQRDRAEKNVDELHRTIVSALEASLESLKENSTFTPVQQEVMDHLLAAHKRLIEEEAEHIEVTPATFECFERLARAYKITGRYDEAIEICERADQMLHPFLQSNDDRQNYVISAYAIAAQRADIANVFGEKEAELELLLKAESYFHEGEAATDRIEWLETGFELYRGLGHCYFGSKNHNASRVAFEQARSYVTQAYDLAPEDEEIQFNFAKSLVDISHANRVPLTWPIGLKDLEQAEKLLTAMVANPEAEVDARYRLAYVRYELGLFLRVFAKDYKGAEERLLDAMGLLKELIDESPGNFGYRNRYSHAYLRLIDVYRDGEMFDEMLRLVPISKEAHLQGMPRKANPRIARSEVNRAKVLAFELNKPELAEASFNLAAETIESSEFFKLSDDLHVDELLNIHHQRSIFYDRNKQPDKAIDAAGDGYRLAVQRALKHPGDRNLGRALHHGTFYADRLAGKKQYGLAKSVLDTLAEAGNDSANTQYKLAIKWAKFDFNQRKAGEDKKLWEASRERSLKLLSRAIDLGFDDFEKLRNDKYFKDYRHLPEFEACCNRIRP